MAVAEGRMEKHWTVRKRKREREEKKVTDVHTRQKREEEDRTGG